MSDLSPSQQAQLDAHTAKHKELLAKKALLDAEFLSLVSQTNNTAAQQARVAAINNELVEISIELKSLTGLKEADSLPADTIVKDAAKQDLVKEVIVKHPAPPPGALNIVHGQVQKNDIISYMTFTQYLNPYGRKRQCDIDLENLMSVINKDCNNQIAEYQDLAKEITYVVGS
jgi:nicotinate-nucleotide pyrophosphorylase